MKKFTRLHWTDRQTDRQKDREEEYELPHAMEYYSKFG
jgi:hypothetical protein